MRPIAIILAAGKGTRMRSEKPKPIVPVKSIPIVKYIINAFNKAGLNDEDIVIVVGYKSEQVKEVLGKKYKYVEQAEQKGTAHAIMEVREKIDWHNRDVFIFVGDSPLITNSTIQQLYDHYKKTNADCTFLTSDFQMNLPYARVIKSKDGVLIKCVEEKNASEEELKITELLSSHFIFKGNKLFLHLDEIQPDSENGEFYLTDIIEIFLKHGLRVNTLKIKGFEELVGLNTPEDVNWAEEILNERAHAKN